MLNSGISAGNCSNTYDVIVVGSGAAGLTAALTAAKAGLKTVVLEKESCFGGTTAISGGGLWIPCSTGARRQGVRDNLDDAILYLKTVTGNYLDHALGRVFFENANAMADFLEEFAGIRFFTTTNRPDYYPDLPGASQGGRTIFPQPFDGRRLGKELKRLRRPARATTFLGMMIKPGPDLHHFFNVFRSPSSAIFVAKRLLLHIRDVAFYGRSVDLGSGNALIAHLALAAMNAGVVIETDAPVVALLRLENDVRGVRALLRGAEHNLTARRGVVLATGGFAHDSDRQAQLYAHAPTGSEHLSPAPPGNTGDGLVMGEAAGAAIGEPSDAAAWCPVSQVQFRDGTTGVFPHLIDRQKPGFIAVTTDGRRFVNESGSYHEFCRGLIRASAKGLAPICFLVADHQTIRRYGIGFVRPFPLPLWPHLRSKYLIRGRTLRDLARETGIDATVFEKTVAEFNMHAKVGNDPEFGRGSTSYNRYNGDPLHKPNPCVAPIKNGPFYAVKVRIGELGTFAGLRTDQSANVVDKDGVPIPGLYAAGNDMSHFMGGSYIGGGTTLGPGMTFGFVAANAIANKEIEIEE